MMTSPHLRPRVLVAVSLGIALTLSCGRTAPRLPADVALDVRADVSTPDAFSVDALLPDEPIANPDEPSPDVSLDEPSFDVAPRDVVPRDARVLDAAFDGECRSDRMFAIYDCLGPPIDSGNPLLPLDPARVYACCANRCYASTGCTPDRTRGNSCGRDPPCDTDAGLFCCYQWMIDDYQCVPRNSGRCNRVP